MRIEWQISFWVATLALFALLLWVFSGVLLPFAAAFVIAYLLDPFADRLQSLGLGRLAATLLILGGFVIVLVLILVLIVPVLNHQLAALIHALPDLLNKLQGLIVSAAERLGNTYGSPLLQKLGIEIGRAS